MSVKPKQKKNKHYSETVIVYELDLVTKEIKSCDFAYFNFETSKWNVIGTDTFFLHCWVEVPNPTIFMQNKEWPEDFNYGLCDDN